MNLLKQIATHSLRLLASVLFGIFTLVAFMLLANALFFKGPGPNDGFNMVAAIVIFPISLILIPGAWLGFGKKIVQVPVGIGAFLGFLICIWIGYGVILDG